ncbi:hypothetical protein K432DRAFT_392947 [Lepidopterella palustris CBS 459.81]|uniref:Uncharacterized protein n=1 Tax=Lepidopterella palustris CBS 459.81 TaxID=1314670 RepID=A0A8E2JFF6_9PEZI|nr:hypothetical protein K432DRAFT_392947 [Lepidopterella palustris CBS 459.81]
MQTSSLSGTLLAIASPILFVAWTISLGMMQALKAGAGWISVLGWTPCAGSVVLGLLRNRLLIRTGSPLATAWPIWRKGRDHALFLYFTISLIALVELILSCTITTGGIPMVVSENCLLFEFSPRLGILDSSISTP